MKDYLRQKVEDQRMTRGYDTQGCLLANALMDAHKKQTTAILKDSLFFFLVTNFGVFFFLNFEEI